MQPVRGPIRRNVSDVAEMEPIFWPPIDHQILALRNDFPAGKYAAIPCDDAGRDRPGLADYAVASAAKDEKGANDHHREGNPQFLIAHISVNFSGSENGTTVGQMGRRVRKRPQQIEDKERKRRSAQHTPKPTTGTIRNQKS
jgi:hypothetical protein